MAINTPRFYSPKPEVYFTAATMYIKTVLYFSPFIMLIMFSASKVFNDFAHRDSEKSLDTIGFKQNSYLYHSNGKLFQNTINNLKKYKNVPLNQQGKGSIIIDTGKFSVSVFVNGTKVSSNGSCKVTGLEPGEYHIYAEGRDCYSDEENIYLGSETEPVTVKLKINLLGKLIIKSEYKSLSFRVENIEFKPGQEIYLKAGKYKVKPSKDYLPNIETTILEGIENIIDYDMLVPKTALTIKCEGASEIEIYHQDICESTVLDLNEAKSIMILPGLVQLVLKSGKTVITKNIIVKSERFSIDLTDKLNKIKIKNKKIKALLSVSILITLLATILVVMVPILNENKAWSTAKEKNTESAFEEYLANYPNGNHADEARKAMELAAWAETKKLDTETAYWNFINKYPSSLHTNEARSLLEPKYWERIKSIDTEKYYSEYLQKFPYGNYREEALQLLKLSELNLKNFVRNLINLENQKDILGIIKFYSDKVNYFNSGNVDKNFIIRDKQNYYKKWDNINYQFNDNITIEKTKDPFTKIVKYNLGFSLYSSEKKLKIEGITENSLTVKYINDSFKIVEQKGKIISQDKTEYLD